MLSDMLIGHQKQWNFLKNKFESDQLSHAYLFLGESQLGKKTFAKEFIKLVNCLSAQTAPEKTDEPHLRQGFGGQACQKCQNCQMIEKGNFPDLLMIDSNEGELKIEKIREAQNFLSYKSYYGSFKAVIVNDAEKMNQEAQSCFLKTLEEPKGKTIIILISSRSEVLLNTITSRCQTVKFFLIDSKSIKDYLEQQGVSSAKAEILSFVSGGKPGRAYNLFLNPDKIEKEKKLLKEILGVLNSGLAEKFKYAKSVDLESQNLNEILAVLIKYFRYLLFLKIGVETPKEQKYFIEPTPSFKNYPMEKIKKIISLIEYINQQVSFTNVNQKLALEYLLVEL